MPPRTPTRRRRNPEPPQTLRDYRADAFADALARTGRFTVERPGRQDLIVSLRDFKVRLQNFGDSNAWFADGWRSESVEYGPLKVRREGRDLFAHVNEVAEQLGEIIRWAGPVPEENLIKDSEGYRAYVFLPSSVKDRPAAAQAAADTLRNHFPAAPAKVAAASVKLAKALAESQPMLAAVPRKYRKQIAALLQQAFENDDLATYLQARELAELISEPSSKRRNPPPAYIPASARRQRAEADEKTLEHHAGFLARVRALKEKYGESWQFPELAGLTPVPYAYAPASLGEHLLADFAQGVVREGAAATAPQGQGPVVYGLGFADGSRAVVAQELRTPLGALAVTAFQGDPRIVGEALVRVAERTGTLLSIEDAALARAMRAVAGRRGLPSLYVPSHLKNKREIASAYFTVLIDREDADALYTLAKAVRDAMFPRVPKAYKPKFARLVSHAFGDEALGFLNVRGERTDDPDQIRSYLQARDLAELISE